MEQIQYEGIKCEGTLKIGIEEENRVYIYVEDPAGHRAEISLNSSCGFGKHLADYVKHPPGSCDGQ